MNKRVVIAAIAGIIAVALFLTFRIRTRQDPGVLPLSGNVEATEVHVGFKISGRVVALLTDEGRRVRIDEKIAVLDSAEYESQVNQHRAMLRNAEATLDKARKDAERAEALFTSGAIARQQLDAARTASDVSLAQVQQAAAALRTAELKLKDTVIHSPAAGVVQRKLVEEGETVAAGAPVYTIGALDLPWIKVYVPETRLGLVKLGQKAEISTDSYPGKIYEGTVTYISSEAEFTPKYVQTREERVKLVYGVKVSVKNVNDELKPSMPADVKILLK